MRLEQRGRALVELLPRVERLRSRQGPVRMEQGRVVVSPLAAEARLPCIDVPELLIDVDQWPGFSHHLRHLHGREPRPARLPARPLCGLPGARRSLWAGP